MSPNNVLVLTGVGVLVRVGVTTLGVGVLVLVGKAVPPTVTVAS